MNYLTQASGAAGGTDETNYFTTLLDAANWTPVPGQPQFVNGHFVLTQPVTTPAQFYRLRQP